MRDFRWDLAAGFDAMVGEMSSAAVDAVAAADRGTYRAFAGHPGFFRPAWGSGWALVGDAGYFKDPITAHGITDALRDAELLARAVTTGTDAALAAYQTIRDELSATLFSVSDEIASFAWDMPRLQALHRVLSEEMTKETVHVSRLGNALQAV